MKQIITMKIQSGKGKDGEKEFKRYPYPQQEASRLTDHLLTRKQVKVSAIGEAANFNMNKIIAIAKDKLNPIFQYADKGSPKLIVLDFGSENLTFDNGRKAISNYFLLQIQESGDEVDVNDDSVELVE